MCIGVFETASPAVLWWDQKSPFVWLFVRTLHELACVRRVVTRSLPRFLLVHSTWRHSRTKKHAVIWTCVRTQETKRDLRRNTLCWTRRTTRPSSVSRMPRTYGVGRASNMKVCVGVSKLRLSEHILLLNSWPSRCSKNETFEFFFPLLVQIEQRKASKAPKNRFSKRTHFSGVRRVCPSAVLS